MVSRRRKGFTLLELLIVVLIVAILAAVIMPAYDAMVWQARYTEMFSTFAAIAQAKEAYFAEHGTYEGDPPYGYNECLAGKGTVPGSTRVQQDLGLKISNKCYFRYLIYPSTDWPNENCIYFGQEWPNDWAYLWDYSRNLWAAYGGADSPAKRHFRPPDN